MTGRMLWMAGIALLFVGEYPRSFSDGNASSVPCFSLWLLEARKCSIRRAKGAYTFFPLVFASSDRAEHFAKVSGFF